MKDTDNLDAWEDLNERFLRDLDSLRNNYAREAQRLTKAGTQGPAATRARGSLLTWFDRKTRLRTFPGIIVVIMTLHIIVFLILWAARVL